MHYIIPEYFDTIWRMGKRYFQIWNYLYYHAQVKAQASCFCITPYLIKNHPVLITDIKKSSLYEYLVALSEQDPGIRFDEKHYLTTGEFRLSISFPESGGIPVPVEFTELSLLKGKLLHLRTEVPALLYLFKEISLVGNIDFHGKIPFSIYGQPLLDFIRYLSGRYVLPSDLFDRLQRKKVLRYSTDFQANQFSGALCWKEFVESHESIPLKLKIGAMDQETGELYKRLSAVVQGPRSTSKCSYVLVAGSLPVLFRELPSLPTGELAPDSLIETIIRHFQSCENRGKYSLNIELARLLEPYQVIPRWQDFSCSDAEERIIRTIDVPNQSYRSMVLNYYFYPGGCIGNSCDTVSYGIETKLTTAGENGNCRVNLHHSSGLHQSYKLVDAYQGPFVCRFSGKSGKFDKVDLSVRMSGGFRKLNLRVLVVLVGEGIGKS